MKLRFEEINELARSHHYEVAEVEFELKFLLTPNQNA